MPGLKSTIARYLCVILLGEFKKNETGSWWLQHWTCNSWGYDLKKRNYFYAGAATVNRHEVWEKKMQCQLNLQTETAGIVTLHLQRLKSETKKADELCWEGASGQVENLRVSRTWTIICNITEVKNWSIKHLSWCMNTQHCYISSDSCASQSSSVHWRSKIC